MKIFPRITVVGVTGAIAALSLFMPSCGGSAVKTGTGSTGGTAGASAGGSTATGGTTSTDTCATAADCTWGEIDKEILKTQDCMCLYGCPFLPQTNATAQRRQQQYTALCNPNKDGTGQTCGIDDCALPGAIACLAGACKAAPGDAGPAQ
jgi:hypothetical protein